MRNNYFLCIIFLIFNFSCKQYHYLLPKFPHLNLNSKNTSILELKKTLKRERQRINKENIIIEGIIIANSEGGNFYKKIYIRDQSGAIGVSIEENAHGKYVIGDSLRILATGLYLEKKNDEISLIDFTSQLSQSHGILHPAMHIVHVNDKNLSPILPKSLEIDSLNDDLIGNLIKIDGIKFEYLEENQRFVDEKEKQTYITHKLEDRNGKKINLVLSKFVDFGERIIPKKSGSVTGILTKYQGEYQIKPRTFEDIKLNEVVFESKKVYTSDDEVSQVIEKVSKTDKLKISSKKVESSAKTKDNPKHSSKKVESSLKTYNSKGNLTKPKDNLKLSSKKDKNTAKTKLSKETLSEPLSEAPSEKQKDDETEGTETQSAENTNVVKNLETEVVKIEENEEDKEEVFILQHIRMSKTRGKSKSETGSGNRAGSKDGVENKYIIICNKGDKLADLSQYKIERFIGPRSLNPSQELSGELESGEVLILKHSKALNYMDGIRTIGLSEEIIDFKGNDEILLKKGEELVDKVGNKGKSEKWNHSRGNKFLRRKDGYGPNKEYKEDEWEELLYPNLKKEGVKKIFEDLKSFLTEVNQ